MRPEITFGAVANIFSRMMHFKNSGDAIEGHKHLFDHLTLLASGSLKVIVEGEETIFTAPHMIYITAEKAHQLVALEDNTVAYCIHAIRDKETGDILDPNMVPKGVHETGKLVGVQRITKPE